MKRNQGSAYLTVLGAIVVLTIMTFSLLSSKTNRANMTLFLSKEKKAEAVAEAAVDIMQAYLRRAVNSEEKAAEDIYRLLRIPLKLDGNELCNPGGTNKKLSLIEFTKVPTFDEHTAPLDSLKGMIDELGGDDYVDVQVTCGLVHAEALCADSSVQKDYEVVGITTHAKNAKGKSATFLDSVDNPADSDQSLNTAKWRPSNWDLEINLPNLEDKNEKKFKIDLWWPLPDLKVKLTIKKFKEAGESMIEVLAETKMGDYGPKKYNITKEILDKAGFLKGINPLNVIGLREKLMPNAKKALTMNYQATKLRSLIQKRYAEVVDYFDTTDISKSGGTKVEKDSFDTEPRIIEKGGLLQIRAIVFYYPNGKKNGKEIRRELIARLPFKVADIHPMAPEYSFFVANSPLIKEGRKFGGADGRDLDLNASKIQGTSFAAVGYFIVHNIPSFNFIPDFFNITGFTHTGNDKMAEGMIPGMVRVNGKKEMEIAAFLGTKAEPELTELNAMVSPHSSTWTNNKFQTMPAFQWKGDKLKRLHEVEVPVIFDEDPCFRPVNPAGVMGIYEVYKRGGLDLMMVPTLLYGKGHLEYPLGIRPEGPLLMKFARISVEASPKGKVSFPFDFKDKTRIYVYYDNATTYRTNDLDNPKDDKTADGKSKYGMIGYPGYDNASEWNSTKNFKLMPANCYSLLQYAKKARWFYNTQEEFKAALAKSVEDGGHLNPDGSVCVDGVIYIKNDLNLTSDFCG